MNSKMHFIHMESSHPDIKVKVSNIIELVSERTDSFCQALDPIQVQRPPRRENILPQRNFATIRILLNAYLTYQLEKIQMLRIVCTVCSLHIYSNFKKNPEFLQGLKKACD